MPLMKDGEEMVEMFACSVFGVQQRLCHQHAVGLNGGKRVKRSGLRIFRMIAFSDSPFLFFRGLWTHKAILIESMPIERQRIRSKKDKRWMARDVSPKFREAITLRDHELHFGTTRELDEDGEDRGEHVVHCRVNKLLAQLAFRRVGNNGLRLPCWFRDICLEVLLFRG